MGAGEKNGKGHKLTEYMVKHNNGRVDCGLWIIIGVMLVLEPHTHTTILLMPSYIL